MATDDDAKRAAEQVRRAEQAAKRAEEAARLAEKSAQEARRAQEAVLALSADKKKGTKGTSSTGPKMHGSD